MKKLKPFLIGSIVGCAVMFVALQYHLVRSQEGFRLVPRTPQPSLGLAYLNVGRWSAEDWADRPEVARAMAAAGLTDLIASSVADNLRDDVSGSDSAIDQLRGYMDRDSSQGGLQIPDADSNDSRTSGADPRDDFRDLMPSFERDTKKQDSGRVARSDQFSMSNTLFDRNRSSDTTSFGSSFEESPQGNSRSTLQAEPMDPFRETTSGTDVGQSNSNVANNSLSATDESDVISDMLFGDESPSTELENRQSGGWQDSVSSVRGRLTDNVSKRVSDEADRMANDFRTRMTDVRNQAFDQTLESLEDTGVGRIKESVKNSLGRLPGSATIPTASDLPPELRALQEGFDPFIR